MKEQKMRNLIREVINLIVKFFKDYSLKEEVLSIPHNVKKMGYKISLISMCFTTVGIIFSFLLKLTNILIEERMIFLGIVVFMLYRGEAVVSQTMALFESSEGKKFNMILEDEIVVRGSQIIGKVANKVYKFDSQNKVYKLMSNEEVLNALKNYLENLWNQNIQHIVDIYQIVSTIIMIIITISTNTSISQYLFIPLIVFFIIISFLSSAYLSLNRKEFHKKNKRYNNEQLVIVNDLLRVPIIVPKDLEMRIGNLQQSVEMSNQNVDDYHKHIVKSSMLTTILEAFSQYGIIIFYLIGLDWSSISLSTITEITATLVVVETCLHNVSRIAGTLNNNNERLNILENEEMDIKLILNVYKKENEKVTENKEIEEISINPFSIKYLEQSENDRPFQLISKNKIEIKKGEVVLLYGKSGSGKSTFMKLITGQIKVEKSNEIPQTSRFLNYDEKSKFGSLTIFEELFCKDPNPNLKKMQEILKNLYLWSEIKSNCIDVWEWMKEKILNNHFQMAKSKD